MEVFFVLVTLIVFFFLKLYFNSPTVIGAQGERRVSSTLKRRLPEKDYIILDDLTLPTTRGTTQIDHVVLSQHGIFVVETKNMSGWIFGSEKQPRWTQTMRRHKSQFQNPLRQNFQHVKVVQELLGVRTDQVKNLVAFVGSAEPKTIMPQNVFWSRQELLSYIQSQTLVQFSDGEVQQFAQKLRRRALEDNKETRCAHIANLHTQTIQKSSNTSICPRCGSNMVSRTNKKTGEAFLGCSTFPKCRATREAT